MKLPLTLVCAALIAGCTTVDTTTSDYDTSMPLGDLDANQFTLALNAYAAGFFSESEIMFKGIMNSDLFSYDEQDAATLYWLASAGQSGSYKEIAFFLENNNVGDANVPGDKELDLGFSVDSFENWSCYSMEKTDLDAAIDCWAENQNIARSKDLILEKVTNQHAASRILP